MKDYDIQQFDVTTASKKEWTKFHKYRRKRNSEVFPGDPVEDDMVYEEWEKTSIDEFEINSYAVSMKENPSEIVAWLQLCVFKETSPSYSGNEHMVIVRSMAVLKEYRRRGIGLDLLKLVYDFAAERKKRLVLGGTAEKEGRELNRLLGGTEALEMRINRLSMDKVDWNMVEKWESEGTEKSPDASLMIYSSIPDNILEDYCKKYTEVYNQMPLDELDVGHTVYTPELWRKYEDTSVKTGETWLTAVIREKNGDISGLTDIIYHPSKAPLLKQLLTGVDQKYRGKGKGKWVKAAMLLKVREKFPDIKTISTSTATSNAPMIAINERLGFKLHREIFNIQVDTEKLGQFLKGR